MHAEETHCHSSNRQHGAFPVPGPKLLWTTGIFVLVLLVSYLEPLANLNESLLKYVGTIWWAVLLGLLIGGVIDYFVPDGFIVRMLGGRSRYSLMRAVLAGFLMSACSHGILAIAMQLYKKGASVPAVITFLLASPWANLPMTILMFGFFGWQAAIIVLAAMLIAISTGAVFTILHRLGWIEGSNEAADPDETEWRRELNPLRVLRGVAAGALSLANMVLWWILVGVMIAALIGAYVPEHWFMQYLGPGISGLLLTLLFATVIEICSEGSAPLAFEIFSKVGALGNPFIFLMAGVATDYTEIGLLWTNIGRRTAIWLPIVAVPQILLVAFLMNSWL